MMGIVITVIVDSRLRVQGAPPAVLRDLKSAFTHDNPDFHKARKAGYSVWGKDSKIRTWIENAEGTELALPRGGTARLREVAKEHGQQIRFVDRRRRLPEVEWPKLRIELRDYQIAAARAAHAAEQGLVRAPTGGGKTIAVFGLLGMVKQPALVIMRDSNLLTQWKENAVKLMGLSPKEIGVLKGGEKMRIGPRLTLALQQTLYSGRVPPEEVTAAFGIVVVDEVHLCAAATFQTVIDRFDAAYRVGVSADETRKDRKEFLIYDQFGQVVYSIERDELERRKVIHPVAVKMIPTSFTADWYRDAGPGERDFNRLMQEMTSDEQRQSELVALIEGVLEAGETPCFVFSNRREHARELADVVLFQRGIKAGLMIGDDEHRERFEEDKARLLAGTLPIAVGTFQAIGTGLDVPNVTAGIVATPIGKNKQFFGQVRGRICRTAEAHGKNHAVLYVMWDRAVFPDMPKLMSGWNGGNTTVLRDDGSWTPVK